MALFLISLTFANPNPGVTEFTHEQNLPTETLRRRQFLAIDTASRQDFIFGEGPVDCGDVTFEKRDSLLCTERFSETICTNVYSWGPGPTRTVEIVYAEDDMYWDMMAMQKERIEHIVTIRDICTKSSNGPVIPPELRT